MPGNPRIARIGCSTEANIDVRLCSAKADAYGSWSKDKFGALREAPGFTRWVMQAIPVTRASMEPTVVTKTRTIEIMLPKSMSRRQFDGRLHAALAGWSLADQNPQQARFTKYSMGADRISLAREFYIGLDPREDGDRLLSIVEDIVREHRAKQYRDVAGPPLGPAEIHLSRDKSIGTMSPTQVQAMETRRRWGRKQRGS